MRGKPDPLLMVGQEDHGNQDGEYIWAVQDINLEVKQGEVLGIIGKNGAGKSTLLKIISQITSPTAGNIKIQGRIASLLEVGTGFHPELTGRQNVYLNGAILGMTKSEIDKKFDEIVEFSGVEKYIDTPVKRYSSGMHVRLGFAVAAHLSPEILIVDEVLAVGDAEFQKRCLGKMRSVAKEGRTVLFVSHNMNAISFLCSRAILLEQGHSVRDGNSAEVVAEYLRGSHERSGECVWQDPRTAPGNDQVRIRAVRILQNGEVTADVDIQKDVSVELEYWNFRPDARISTSIHLLDKMGATVLCSVSYPAQTVQTDEWFDRPWPTGLFRSTCIVPGNFLNVGRYGISAFVRTNIRNIEAAVPEAVWFTVCDTVATHQELGGWGGVVRPHLVWQTELQRSLCHDNLERQ